METGRPLAAPATPPRGGDTKHVILSGAGSATARELLALRPRAGAPGSRAESEAPAPGCPGRSGRGSQRPLAGCAARGSLAPSCPIRAGPGARRAAWGRRSASQGRRESATDTCLQEPARRARSARSGSASCRPGGRRPRRRPPGSSSRSSSSPRSPSRARRGPGRSSLRAAPTRLRQRRCAPSSIAGALDPAARALPASPPGLFPAAAAASGHTRTPILTTSGT